MYTEKHKLYSDYYRSGVILGWAIATAIIPYCSLNYLLFSEWKEYSDIPVEIPIAATILGSIAFIVLFRQILTRPVEGFAIQNGILLKYVFKSETIPWKDFKSFDYTQRKFERRNAKENKIVLKWVVKLFYIEEQNEYMQFTVKSEDDAIETCLLLEDLKNQEKL